LNKMRKGEKKLLKVFKKGVAVELGDQTIFSI
jgi:hypothetical protein